jgi:hypothetical protein
MELTSLQSPFIGLLQVVSVRGDAESCAVLLKNDRLVAYFGARRWRKREFQRDHLRDLLSCRSKLTIELRFIRWRNDHRETYNIWKIFPCLL